MNIRKLFTVRREVMIYNWECKGRRLIDFYDFFYKFWYDGLRMTVYEN
jgi:hypothetical protein